MRWKVYAYTLGGNIYGMYYKPLRGEAVRVSGGGVANLSSTRLCMEIRVALVILHPCFSCPVFARVSGVRGERPDLLSGLELQGGVGKEGQKAQPGIKQGAPPLSRPKHQPPSASGCSPGKADKEDGARSSAAPHAFSTFTFVTWRTRSWDGVGWVGGERGQRPLSTRV